MEDKIFRDFFAETIEGFTLSDCKSCVLSNMILERLREKPLKEAVLIFQSLPNELRDHLIVFLTDTFMEDILVQN
jgi:hypothetical protein